MAANMNLMQLCVQEYRTESEICQRKSNLQCAPLLPEFLVYSTLH